MSRFFSKRLLCLVLGVVVVLIGLHGELGAARASERASAPPVDVASDCYDEYEAKLAEAFANQLQCQVVEGGPVGIAICDLQFFLIVDTLWFELQQCLLG